MLERISVTVERAVRMYFLPSTSKSAVYFPRKRKEIMPGMPYNSTTALTVKLFSVVLTAKGYTSANKTVAAV